jgi:hypothetical protein
MKWLLATILAAALAAPCGVPPPPVITGVWASMAGERDTCGSAIWDIYGYDGWDYYYYGYQTAFGVCTGGFTDCWNNYVDQDHVDGNLNGAYYDGSDEYADYYYFWVDSWYTSNSNCDASDPNPSGMWQYAYNMPFQTQDFAVPTWINQ